MYIFMLLDSRFLFTVGHFLVWVFLVEELYLEMFNDYSQKVPDLTRDS